MSIAKIKRYFVILKLIFSEVKNPLFAIIILIFKSGTYTFRIRGVHTVISGNRVSILEKLIETHIQRESPNGSYIWRYKEKVYHINVGRLTFHE